MRNFLRYIKDKNGKIHGAVALYEDNGYFGIGYSIHHPSDPFSKKVGRQLAFDRAYECYKEEAFSYYDLIDNIWFGEIYDKLPPVDISEKVIDELFELIEDVKHDYANRYFRSLAKS